MEFLIRILTKVKERKKVGLILFLGVILFSGSIFLGVKIRKKDTSSLPSQVVPEEKREVEVELLPRKDKKAVILKIAKIPDGVTSIDYELTYETEEGLPRGVLGTIRLQEGERRVEREIILGTCSRNVCVYDTGVEKVNLVLKFNSPQGSFHFQKEYKL